MNDSYSCSQETAASLRLAAVSSDNTGGPGVTTERGWVKDNIGWYYVKNNGTKAAENGSQTVEKLLDRSGPLYGQRLERNRRKMVLSLFYRKYGKECVENRGKRSLVLSGPGRRHAY